MSNREDKIPSKDITPEETYMSRRAFLRAGTLVGAVAATAGAYYYFNRGGYVPPTQGLQTLKAGGAAATGPAVAATGAATVPAASMSEAERIAAGFFTKEPQTPFEVIAGYNNFYEFSTSKTAVARLAKDFVSRPWSLRVDGLVSNPTTFDLDDLQKLGLEDRVYRFRCVEAWSMVIPWLGFPLAALLNKVAPHSSARYVKFETLVDPKRMPNQEDDSVLPWPYVEGLRIDEAMHPLTILAMGLYGKTLPPQNGAPVRLVTPWKYGFKGIKSIVHIELVKDEPLNTWQLANAREYGFYSNVNPNVSHPRWSQASERRFNGSGDEEVIETKMFNGYATQVAGLYTGMDLARYY